MCTWLSRIGVVIQCIQQVSFQHRRFSKRLNGDPIIPNAPNSCWATRVIICFDCSESGPREYDRCLAAWGARVFVACGHIGQVKNFFINRFISVLVRPFVIATGTGFNNHMLLLIRAVWLARSSSYSSAQRQMSS